MSVTPGCEHAGNLIDDGNFQYIYDAWNRLVKVRSDGDTDVTFQTAEFFADGRRARKDVSNSGAYDTAEVYLYDGQKIIETRDGSNNVNKQFVGCVPDAPTGVANKVRLGRTLRDTSGSDRNRLFLSAHQKFGEFLPANHRPARHTNSTVGGTENRLEKPR